MNRAALRAQLHAAVDALVDALPVEDVARPAESKPVRRRRNPDPLPIPQVDDVTAARARAVLRRRGLPVKESA